MRLFERTKIRRDQQESSFVILDDVVCFPGSMMPLYINARPAILAVDAAMAAHRFLFLANRKLQHDGLDIDDMCRVGTLVRIVQVMKLPNNGYRLLVEGLERAGLDEILDTSDNPRVLVQPLELDNTVNTGLAQLMKVTSETFTRYSVLHKKVPKDAITKIEQADAPHKLVDLIASHVQLSYETKLSLLENLDPVSRLRELSVAIEAECELLDLRHDISGRVKKRMEQNQKEYFINEQIRELNKELGKEEDDASGAKELESRLKAKDLPDDARLKTQNEIKRLGRLQPMTPEAGIVRTYLEWICDLPWGRGLPDKISIDEAERILNEDHYDLEDAKDRLLDYLAVRRIRNDLKAPILCFVGPPGTGKTSLGKSLARALGRPFVRISLGGVRDEAEIRGHRRTYVGAMPGKIIQGMKKAGKVNPVFLLDEIDKLANDHRGDPSSALLEVLDPEQNNSFSDHYLELAYDLSQVIFIATANNLSNIPNALRDRMEIIEIPGYTRYDKLKIAEGFIVPKQLREHGLEKADIRFDSAALLGIVDDYTMEAGVRSLERHIAKVIRKLARTRLGEADPVTGSYGESIGKLSVVVDSAMVREFLKRPRTRQDLVSASSEAGVVYGLAWTENGGTVMPVEVSISPGKGEVILTGSLGDVMKESARIALSLVRGLPRVTGEGTLKDSDIHVHVPEGAIPKDGPSAGITLVSAIVSALSKQAIPEGTAMTGEVTLTGRVLAVGGIREKVLAAHRHKLTHLILPSRNQMDTEDLPEEILSEIHFDFVDTVADVLSLIFPKGHEPKKSVAPAPGNIAKPEAKAAAKTSARTSAKKSKLA